MNPSKAKGTAAETATLRFLEEKGIQAVRNPPAGSNDRGDIRIFGRLGITVEVKNHQRMELAAWVDESLVEQKNAGTDFAAVVHKRKGRGKPQDWYLTMTVGQFTELVRLLNSVE